MRIERRVRRAAILLCLPAASSLLGAVDDATLAMSGVASPVHHMCMCITVLRGGGGERTLPTQPWITEGLRPEEDPAGNIWETKSWRERIRRHQQDKTARKWTEYDAYGPVKYVRAHIVLPHALHCIAKVLCALCAAMCASKAHIFWFIGLVLGADCCDALMNRSTRRAI